MLLFIHTFIKYYKVEQMKQRTDNQGVPYSYLVDNIKVVLIFLVVFNHLIAFQLVKVDMVVRYVWYGSHHFSTCLLLFLYPDIFPRSHRMY